MLSSTRSNNELESNTTTHSSLPVKNQKQRENAIDLCLYGENRRYVSSSLPLGNGVSNNDGSSNEDGTAHKIDIQNLRRICSLGISDNGSHRAVAWRVLLGYLPFDHSQWEEVLQDERDSYRQLVRELFEDPETNNINDGEYNERKDKLDEQVFDENLNNSSDSQSSESNTLTVDENHKALKDDQDQTDTLETEEITQSTEELDIEKENTLDKLSDIIHVNSDQELNEFGLTKTSTTSTESYEIIQKDAKDINDSNELSYNCISPQNSPMLKVINIPSRNPDLDIIERLQRNHCIREKSKAPTTPPKNNNNSTTSALKNTMGAIFTPTSGSWDNEEGDLDGNHEHSDGELSSNEHDTTDGIPAKQTSLSQSNTVDNQNECKLKQFDENVALLDEIRKDVVRTHPSFQFYLEPEDNLGQQRYAAIERILFVWAKLNKGVRYVQGMNEIVGTIFFVLATDSNKEWAQEAEADAYFLFNILMAEMRDVFIPHLDEADTGIQGRIANFVTLLSLHDPEIKCHLDDIGIDASFFCIRWLTTLLSREFMLPETIRVWDSMFASTHKDNFLRYVCVSMVMVIRKQLLQSDFSTCLRLLQSYPPTNIDRLLESSRALWIYESQVTLACYKGGIRLQHALVTLVPPPAIVMAYGLSGGNANRKNNQQSNLPKAKNKPRATFNDKSPSNPLTRTSSRETFTAAKNRLFGGAGKTFFNW